MPESAFSSTDPRVLTAWEQYGARHEQARERLAELGDRFDRPVMVTRGVGGLRLSGLDPVLSDRESPPEGLRVDSRSGLLMPDKRTAAGKAVAPDFDIACDPPNLPGMPSDCWSDDRVYRPGYMLEDGSVIVSWGCSAERLLDGGLMGGPGVDTALWTAMPLSEWYAHVEKRERVKAEANS